MRGGILYNLCKKSNLVDFYRLYNYNLKTNLIFKKRIMSNNINVPSSVDEYNHLEIEKKWREKWETERTFSVDLDNAKNPYYNLMMFPYPSAEWLHVWNFYAFTWSDVNGRYNKIKGADVFEPMWWDAFWIHSENYAKKIWSHPLAETPKNVKTFKR